MAFVDRVTALRPDIGETGWGEKLNAYLVAVEDALENLDIQAQSGAAGPYAANLYLRPSQTSTLPADLPAGTLVVVPLDA